MIYGYVRVSSDGQTNGTSPEEQERKCRAIAQLRSTNPYDFLLYRDDAVSGKTPIAERPAGREMLAAAQKGDCIVASKLDRMFRNTLDAFQMLQFFKERGISVILADLSSEPVTDDGIGKIVFGLMAMFADFERERIGARVEEGRRAKRARGGHVAGSAPYGYKVEGRGKNARLVPDEQEQIVVKMIHDLHPRLYLSSVASILKREGYRSRSGRPFELIQLRRILSYQKDHARHVAG